ncbi:MAG: epimerase, partial [Verrucomicrobia bacterium]|nr:epimerase [Cytophagales bacterium]
RSKLTGSRPLVTRETAMLSERKYVYDSSKVKETLGFNFRSLEETLTWIAS